VKFCYFFFQFIYSLTQTGQRFAKLSFVSLQ